MGIRLTLGSKGVVCLKLIHEKVFSIIRRIVKLLLSL